MIDRDTLGIPDPLQEFNDTPEPTTVRAPNRRERRAMDRSAQGAARRWVRSKRRQGVSDEDIGLLLDYAETLPELVTLPERTPQ
jgi:hypothetical protein